MESCCALGNIVNEEKILFQTDNFFIAPTKGPIGIRGYLLICSKQHFEGIGGTPETYHKELEENLKKTKKILSETYNSKVIVFEHGPKIGCFKGGGCFDHAHLHVLPVATNVMISLIKNLLNALEIRDYYNVERMDKFNRLNEIHDQQESSYFFTETNDGKRYLTNVNFTLPSQYIRQILAFSLKRQNWDWRIHPDYQTLNKTLDDLENKFK